jgi:ribose/xylose/arabinose/galactoside ABC-type transport system permease subunit
MAARKEELGGPGAGEEHARGRSRLAVVGQGVSLIGGQNLGLLAALAILVAIIRTQSPYFFLSSNLLNIGSAISVLGVLAIVQTVVIVSGGLDISVGSAAGLTSVMTATALMHVHDLAFGLFAGLGIGLAAGTFNGIVITFGRVNPVIATLATFSAFRGAAELVTNGNSVGVTNSSFNYLGSGRLAGLPVPFVILLGVAVVFFVALRYTDIGRNVYALGGNPTAARLAGINVTRYKLGIYMVSGLMAGLAGILLTARTTSGQPISGSQGLELASITAALLGGAALNGGKGTIVGAFLGVTILGVLENGLTLLNVSSFYQDVARGGLLVAAVILQEFDLSGLRLRRGAAAGKGLVGTKQVE